MKPTTPQKLLNHHLIEQFVSNNNDPNGNKPDIPKLNLSVIQKMKETEDVSEIDITRRRRNIYGQNKKTKSYALTTREAMHCVRRSYLDELRKQVLTPTFHPPPNSHKRKKRRRNKDNKHKASYNKSSRKHSAYIGGAQTYRSVTTSSQSSAKHKRKNHINNFARFYPKTSRYTPQNIPQQQQRNTITYPHHNYKHHHHQHQHRNSSSNQQHNHQQYQKQKRVAPPKSARSHYSRSSYQWVKRSSMKNNNNDNIIQPPHLNIVRKVKRVIKSNRNRNDIKSKYGSRRNSSDSSYPYNGDYNKSKSKHQQRSYPTPTPPPKYSRIIGGNNNNKTNKNKINRFKRASGIKQVTDNKYKTGNNYNSHNSKNKKPSPPKYKPRPPSSKNYNGRKRYNKRIIR